MSRPPAGGLVASDRGRRGPFAVLVQSVASDAAAASGLAAAYASLGLRSRARLVQAVVADAGAEGVTPGAALAILLSAERDPRIAQLIFTAITAHGGVGPATPATGLLLGDEDRGAAAVIRPLFGDLAEFAAVSWGNDGVNDVVYEPVVTRDEVGRHVGRLGWSPPQEPCSAERALDRIAEAVWNHHRLHGRLPRLVGRLSSLF